MRRGSICTKTYAEMVQSISKIFKFPKWPLCHFLTKELTFSTNCDDIFFGQEHSFLLDSEFPILINDSLIGYPASVPTLAVDE